MRNDDKFIYDVAADCGEHKLVLDGDSCVFEGCDKRPNSHYWKCMDCLRLANSWDENGEPYHPTCQVEN